MHISDNMLTRCWQHVRAAIRGQFQQGHRVAVAIAGSCRKVAAGNVASGKNRPARSHCNVGALIIRVGFWRFLILLIV